MNAFIRPYIWVKRFRHRCGYGVHSPFAFNLITKLFYEKTPYYDYATLAEREHREGNHMWRCAERTKVKRLLFRLVNWAQPHTVVAAGRPTAASIYLQAGCLKQQFHAVTTLAELQACNIPTIDLLYISCSDQPGFRWQVFDALAARTTSKSVFAVSGINSSVAMKGLWKRMQQDPRTGITFDLYDIGIIFFDKGRFKQHYLVNF